MKLHSLALVGLAVAGSSLVLPAPAPAAVLAAGLAAPGLTGRWTGSITLPTGKLDFSLHFTAEDAGTITIPAQGAKDLPLESVALSGSDATFKIKDIPGDPTFTGKLEGDAVKGSFKQGGGTFVFEIRREEDANKQAADVLAGFDEFVEQARLGWNAPGVAVAIVKRGDVIYSKGFGYRDVEQKLPVTENTLFPIGSSTKAFTTFVLGQLADEGKIDWDKPVTTYLPEFRLADQEIGARLTPRDLVTHRSGLPRHDLVWYGNTPHTREELVKRLAFLPANKDLRETWQYNNLMFLTAGFLEERLTGRSWEENVRERIFVPLNMKRSTFTIRDMEKDSDFALGYRLDDDTDKVERMDFREIASMGPAGSINSSVNEMVGWVKLQLSDGFVEGKPLIKTTTLRDMQTPYMFMGAGSPDAPEIIPVGYGMGWFVDVYRGHQRIHHGGNIDGFSALVLFFPQEEVGMVILTNMNGSGLNNMIARHAADRLLGLSRDDWNGKALAKRALARAEQKKAKAKLEGVRKTGTHPSHPLTEFVGVYENPGYGNIRVIIDPASNSADPALAFDYNGIITPLEHWHYDVFNAKKAEKDAAFEGFKLLFGTGEDGEIQTLQARMEPQCEPFVFRRLGDAKLSDPAYLTRFVGDFSIDGQPVKFALKDKLLTATIPGQPVYELEPARNDTFRIKTLPGFSIRFLSDGDECTKAEFIQPNGVFTAARNKK